MEQNTDCAPEPAAYYPAMRFSWLVVAGVCSWLVACGSSSHKKVLLCDPLECGPDAAGGDSSSVEQPDAEAPDASPDADAGAASAGAPPVAETGEGGAGGTSSVPGDDALEVVIDGTGTVTVANADACLSGPCNYSADPGENFTIQAKPGADSRFVGWSGDCTGTKVGTSVTVHGPTHCVATFAIQRAVTLAVTAAGGGAVASTPNLNCDAIGCKGEVDNHSTVTIIAQPLPGFRFVGWSGSPECTGATQASLPIEVTQDLSCNATFAKQFTVAISALGAAALVSVTTGTCSALACTTDAGASAVFQAQPVTGFRFTGWSGEKACTGAVSPLTIASVESDLTCTAHYAALFTATGVIGGGLAGAVVASSANVNAKCNGNSCTLDSGATATLLAPTIQGYALTGWSGTGCLAANQSGNGITVTPTTSNISCTANYIKGVSVAGTVVGAVGTVAASTTSPGPGCTPGACSINSGGSVTLTAPNLLPTFRFTGWTGDPGDAACTGATLGITLSNVTTSKSCSANYLQQYTVAALTSVGGSVSAKHGGTVCAGNSCTVDPGVSVQLSALPDTANGYYFVAWSGANCVTASDNPLTLVSVNAQCTPAFKLNTYTIAATATGTGGSVSATRSDTNAVCANSTCTVNFGVSVSMTAVPAANYHFAGWTGVGCLPAGTTPLVLSNLNTSCNAAFAINTFPASVTAAPPAGGTVSITCTGGNCGAVPYGQPINVAAAPNAGWSFGSWSPNCAGGTATVTGATNCVATFRPNITTAVSPAGAGTVSASAANLSCVGSAPTTCVADLNSTVNLQANAGTNAVFTGWSGDCAGTNPTLNLVADGPKSCTANFYKLWAQASGVATNDGLLHLKVAALADGTVVSFGNSVAPSGKSSGVALIKLDPNTGIVGSNTLFSDAEGGGTFAALGLTASQSLKSVTALGMHTSSKGRLPWLHNEEKKWDFEYDYGGGSAGVVGGEVISTKDGGYAFCAGITDPTSPTGLVSPPMGHLTKVDAGGTPLFDAKFCARGARNVCAPTFPVDVIQDPATLNYSVLSQVGSPSAAMLITTIGDDGKVKDATLYLDDSQNLSPSQLLLNGPGDSLLVVGSRTDANGGVYGFSSKIKLGGTVPTWAVALGDGSGELLSGVTRNGKSYGIAGVCPDARTKSNDAWYVQLEEDGTLSSQLSYGGPGADRATSITALPAGGLALGGSTNSWGAGVSDFWTLRVAANANISFDTTLATPAKLSKTTFASAPITSINGSTNAADLGASTVAAVTPLVTATAAGFKQVAQTP